MNDETTGRLLGAADIRRIAAEAGVSPTKKLGQNFVIDPGTVRRIAREAGVNAGTNVLEVGPGLGSLTLALLETGANVTAVEIDPKLAARLPQTVAEFMPQAASRLTVVQADALTVTPGLLPGLASGPFTLVANLPYNVATPIVLTLLERFNGLDRFLVMVQKEVADRLVASPGSKTYGSPSVKLAWYGHAERAGLVGRNVFWPAPNVDSALVSFARCPLMRHDGLMRHESGQPRPTEVPDARTHSGSRQRRAEPLVPNQPSTEPTSQMASPPAASAEIAARPGMNSQTGFMPTEALREQTFRLIDLAFGQRRKTLHAALRDALSAQDFEKAGIAPTRRGETLTIDEFAALASAHQPPSSGGARNA
ncbi:ribosomal RNA small subunit methyltransferase A [Bifidobacterium bohemicum]|uniref:Ribosomal RNA small subunit methyltransferase A n=1 Tax=Bifidobacterium bohemicum DSM 22767 TaxID=1437606 RepID=A0A086ZH56_9BIFI|nr:16S rRNA (adenine(1518)-N(6)/adenine(1519)-N(6))-dimethyltransferase RsmA [Bifidobacterium bohemicum]KFI45856.1 dimethyladenosine transferase [Bifidobacterium bohemicum DSM 22767]SCC15680.1 ribosomal RNA small subunit methyltransferase A [Bifidobacterium bohemicum]